MGTAGYIYFCGRGHQFGWIDDDLWWDENLEKHAEDIKEKGCICGDKTIISIPHYGGINDCLCLDSEIQERGIIPIGSEELTVPILDAINSKGKPIKAFRKVILVIHKIPEDVRDGSRWKAPS